MVAYIGQIAADYMQQDILQIVTGAIFVLLGLWMLIPDKAPNTKESEPRFGIFLTSLVIFFLAEMGDKTQIATFTLGAQYDASVYIILGTTLGMMAANAPAILFGEAVLKEIPMKAVRIVASLMFIGFGVIQLCCQ